MLLASSAPRQVETALDMLRDPVGCTELLWALGLSLTADTQACRAPLGTTPAGQQYGWSGCLIRKGLSKWGNSRTKDPTQPGLQSLTIHRRSLDEKAGSPLVHHELGTGGAARFPFLYFPSHRIRLERAGPSAQAWSQILTTHQVYDLQEVT